MNLVYTFDPEKFRLGRLCKHGHAWPGTSYSLRKGYACYACETTSKNWLLNFIDQESLNLPPNTKLGALCKNNHKYGEIEMSLRRTTDSKCVQCEKERAKSAGKKEYIKNWYSKNKQEQSEKAKKRMQKLRENPEWREIEKQRIRDCNAKRYATKGRPTEAQGLKGLVLPPGHNFDQHAASIARSLVAKGFPLQWDILSPLIDQQLEAERVATETRKQQIFENSREGKILKFIGKGGTREEFEQQDAEKKKLAARAKHHLQYEQSEEYRLYHRQKSKRRKAIAKENTAINATGKQIAARFKEFDNRCAYCGATGELHIEHVVPISRGGPHSLGNIVPACPDCNLKKRDSDALEWYKMQSFYSEIRWKKICAVLGWNKSSVGQLAFL
jgi:hypothetical protein